jgi:lipopolysaccharide transport system ATP-binding protein
VRVLRLDHVWKGYRDLGHTPRTLRSSLVGGEILRRLRAPTHWALRDVSLELKAGESVGIVGRNGAGKSTLLRVASRLGRPTRGSVEVDPDTASVLNLGASFDMQLTGRENAFTAALVAGLTAREARKLVPRALRFAEIDDFADAPVRTYSEGMKLRLAFGVIASSSPRLLVLDEVLAVGDAAFRRKCEERIAEMRSEGTSLVLASHGAQEVIDTCARALWLHRGEMYAFGEAEEVLRRYDNFLLSNMLASTPAGLGERRFGSQAATIDAVVIGGTPGSNGAVTVRAGDPLEIVIDISARDGVLDSPSVGVALRRTGDDAVAIEVSASPADIALAPSVREARVRLRLDRVDLVAGEYALDVGLYDAAFEHAYDFHWTARTVIVSGLALAGKGLMLPPLRWSVEDRS